MLKPIVISLADLPGKAGPLQPAPEPLDPVTWEQLAALEPRLADLRARARRMRGSRFCVNQVWYTQFKPELVRLVGWLRRSGPDLLRTSRAYDVAYRAIYDELARHTVLFRREG